jgi:hypothetical protein
MAFKNVLTTGTYTVISVDYDKQSRRITIIASIYADESKSNLITTIPISKQGFQSCKIASVVVKTVADFPSKPKSGDVIFLPTALTVESASYKAGILTYNGTGWNENPEMFVYTGSIFYKYDSANSQYVVDSDPQSSVYWDANFSIDKIQKFKDIYAFSYAFLKANVSIFSTAEDC